MHALGKILHIVALNECSQRVSEAARAQLAATRQIAHASKWICARVLVRVAAIGRRVRERLAGREAARADLDGAVADAARVDDLL